MNPFNPLSSVAWLVRWRLRQTERTRPSPVPGLDQLPCSEPGETTEGDAQHNTSSGPTLDGQELRESTGSPSSSGQVRKESSLKSKPDSGPDSSGQERSEVPQSSRPEIEPGPGPDVFTAAALEHTPSYQNDSDSEGVPVDEEDLDIIINNNEFHAKYQIIEGLKRGGSSLVYTGALRVDGSPVAIKRVPKHNITWFTDKLDSLQYVPVEVGLLSRLRPGPGSDHSRISPVLLDWYELQTEFVIVLQRPEPCMDLVDYVNSLGRYMTEEEARVIFRQLVDAATEMLALGIFHRDIKPDNVIIETGQDEPRARFIDFDCGTSFEINQVFEVAAGTEIYAAPEFYRVGRYTARPTTVWQLGLTLYSMVNMKMAFGSVETLTSTSDPPLRSELSGDCKDLLRRLLDKNPITRISIDSIKDHPWMN